MSPPGHLRKCLLLNFALLLAAPVARGQGLPSLGARIVGDSALLSVLSPSSLKRAGGALPGFGAAEFGPRLPKHPWRTGIVGTVFWVGEQPGPGNPVSNATSSWDRAWVFSFGGVDDPDPGRRSPDYRPAAFVPRQNPFYVALPYNDCLDNVTTKTEASRVVPWFKRAFQRHGQSVCRNRWVAIRHGERVCYAQWSDCGPFVTDDARYVFGNGRPANKGNNGAGIDLAPAVRDYLGFTSGLTCDWRFVEIDEVSDGPWKLYGANNHFASESMRRLAALAPGTFVPAPGGGRGVAPEHPASAAATTAAAFAGKLSPAFQLTGKSRLEELRRQREAWFSAERR